MVPTNETVPLAVPDPLNPRYSYGGGKILSELMCVAWARSGVFDRLIIARPHNVIGPDMGREHVIPHFAIRMNRLVQEHPYPSAIPLPIPGTRQVTTAVCYIAYRSQHICILLK